MAADPSLRSLPFRPLLGFLSGSSAILQAVLLGYRHLTGIHVIPNLATLAVSLSGGMLLGTIAGLALAVPDLRLIRWLDRQYPWGEKTQYRILLEGLFCVVIAGIVSVVATLLSEAVFGYGEPLGDVLIRNGLIFPVVNLLLTAILEGWLLFRKNREHPAECEPSSPPEILAGGMDYKKRFLIRIADKYKKVETAEIAYFFALEKSVFLRTLDGQTCPLDLSLDQVEKAIDPALFFRINRKYVINMNAISTMVFWSKRRIKVELTPAADDPAEVIVSMERYTEFKRWLDR